MLSLIMGLLFMAACQNNDSALTDEELKEFRDTTLAGVEEEMNPGLTIKQGYVSQHAETIRIMRGATAVAVVKLSEPIVVAEAEQSYEWGYFQFPILYRSENGYLIVRYSMKKDSYTAYGSDEDAYRRLMSKDEGNSWTQLDKDYFFRDKYRVDFSNGDVLQVKTPTTKDISEYQVFPKPVNDSIIGNRFFYKTIQLPEELRGVYFTRWDYQSKKTSEIHASLDDDKLLRYTIEGKMPILWWGNIKELNDGSLVAGVYPGFYQNTAGDVLCGGVSFYKSENDGNHWKLIGKIPYQKDGEDYQTNLYGDGGNFEEPTFEILRDGTYMCIMRTGSTAPMYRSFSYDEGRTWTIARSFAPNGVHPNLMLLNNGSLVLSSGRPGVQLRFCIDGDGKYWTEPIEMLPFIDEKGKMRAWLTCGYANMMSYDENTFYIVYSDFTRKNKDGETRKTILFRKIEIIKH